MKLREVKRSEVVLYKGGEVRVDDVQHPRKKQPQVRVTWVDPSIHKFPFWVDPSDLSPRKAGSSESQA